MELSISLIGVVLIATGVFLFVHDVVLTVRRRAAHSAERLKVDSLKRDGIALACEIVGVFLVIQGGTFVS